MSEVQNEVQKMLARTVRSGFVPPITQAQYGPEIQELKRRVTALESGGVAIVEGGGAPADTSEIQDELNELLGMVSALTEKVDAQAKEIEALKSAPKSEPEKPKRKRRTKAEMEALRAAEAKAKAEPEKPAEEEKAPAPKPPIAGPEMTME